MAKVFDAIEHEEVAIPQDLLVRDGRLSIFPEIAQQELFSIRYTKSELVFQAKGFVGVIPVNPEVTIDVRPRAPIQNLQRMLQLSEQNPRGLEALSRRYKVDGEDADTWMRFLAAQFSAALKTIRQEGLYKRYEQRIVVSTTIKGRILMRDTVRRRTRGDPRVATAHFARTSDIPENQGIRFAIRLLHERLSKSRLGPDVKLVRELAAHDRFFSGVESRHHPEASIDRLVSNMPPSRANSANAVSIAKVITNRSAVSVLGEPLHGFEATPVVVNTAIAFEKYVYRVLSDGITNYQVVDGNFNAPRGGARSLLMDADGNPSGINATPDLLVFPRGANVSRERPLIVADCKYKIFKGLPDRDSINQVLTYALSYGANLAVIICPATRPEVSSITYVGNAGEVALLVFAMDLGSDMQRSEGDAVSTWNFLLDTPIADVPRAFPRARQQE